MIREGRIGKLFSVNGVFRGYTISLTSSVHEEIYKWLQCIIERESMLRYNE